MGGLRDFRVTTMTTGKQDKSAISPIIMLLNQCVGCMRYHRMAQRSPRHSDKPTVIKHVLGTTVDSASLILCQEIQNGHVFLCQERVQRSGNRDTDVMLLVGSRLAYPVIGHHGTLRRCDTRCSESKRSRDPETRLSYHQ